MQSAQMCWVDSVITRKGMNSKITGFLLMVIGSWVLALSAHISFPLPFSPVPISAQSLVVLLIGATFGLSRGLKTVGLYLAQGAVGLPFFTGGKAGLAVFAGPTGGYLIGFLVAAGIMGLMSDRGLDRKASTSVALFLLGHFCIFFFGLLALSFLMPFDQALLVGFLPFIPGLIVKTMLASFVTPFLWKYLHEGN